MRVVSVIKTRAGYKVQKLAISDRAEAIRIAHELQKAGISCFVGTKVIDGYPIYTYNT